MKKQFKVLYISPAYPPAQLGGSEISLQMLAEGIKEKNVDVVIISSDGLSKDAKVEKVNGIKVIRIKKPRIAPNTLAHIVSTLKNKKLILNEKPDIVHVYNTWQMPAASIFKKSAKVVATLNNYFPICPIAYTTDNRMEREKFTFFKMLNSTYKTLRFKKKKVITSFFISVLYTLYWRPVYNYSKKLDLYIPVSRTTGEIYALQGFPVDKIKPVYNIIDEKNFNTKLKIKKRRKNSLLYVGGVSESKGVKDLVEALKYVKNKKVFLDLVGKGPVLEEIKEIVSKNNLNVKFHGYLNHNKIEDFYLTSSLLVHTSLWPDPFPRVLIESLYYKIPILSSDHPVAKEVLEDKAAFYKRGDIRDLAKKIDLVTTGKLMPKLETIRKKLFARKPIDEIYQHYKNLLANKVE